VLEYFLFRNKSKVKKIINTYRRSNTLLCECRFPRFIYRSISAFIPLPYCWFFRNNVNVRHFFNFIVPPFSKGKTVVTIHDLGFKRFPETLTVKTKLLLRLNLRKSLKRADLILADSEFTRQEILYFYDCPPEKIRVLYSGVEHERYHVNIPAEEITRVKTKQGITGDYILYLGTLEPRKNIERLISAYAQLKQRQPIVPPLIIAGKKGWLYDGIFEKARSLTDNIHFTGYIPEEDKPGLLAGALFFCFPSLYEGFGLPPLEAMACGTPVLCSNAASLPEVVGDAGLLVDPFSVEEIADGMERLYTNEILRTDMKQKGITQAARFDWERSSGELFKIYESLEALK
jgi:glycosyltransferase involved in cell wall biosynthesis